LEDSGADGTVMLKGIGCGSVRVVCLFDEGISWWAVGGLPAVWLDTQLVVLLCCVEPGSSYCCVLPLGINRTFCVCCGPAFINLCEIAAREILFSEDDGPVPTDLPVNTFPFFKFIH